MHEPVLLEEVLESLQIKPDGRYVDGTLGQGGHAEAIARSLSGGRLLGLEVDPENLKSAEARLQPFGELILTRRVNFRGLRSVLRDVGWESVDGMLFDLGTSVEQLSGPSLSFTSDAPLDMRLDPSSKETALTFLSKVGERELADLFFRYGEFRAAKRLSRTILSELSAGRLNTNADLARLCERVLGRFGPRHPATRPFLAIRAAVNDENGAVEEMMRQAPSLLSVGGRIAVITFHSLEDRTVKHGFKAIAADGIDGKTFSLPFRKPVEPGDEERRRNPRSRSAKLRVLERSS
jgi:16S rRNA (cytosine1402-N4)-methyltransferase